jgi:hypothetical protein
VANVANPKKELDKAFEAFERCPGPATYSRWQDALRDYENSPKSLNVPPSRRSVSNTHPIYRNKNGKGRSHGTTGRYAVGCRCEECRAAVAAHQKKCRDKKLSTRNQQEISIITSM